MTIPCTDADYRVRCGSDADAHAKVRAAGVAFSIVWPLGVPLFFGSLLFIYKVPQMAKIKKFMRYHMASGLRRCWDEWVALVRAQKGEREAKLKRFIFHIKYRMVGRCFASHVLNVRQNAITRRFLFLMHAACVVNTFEAWYGKRRGGRKWEGACGRGDHNKETRAPACAV